MRRALCWAGVGVFVLGIGCQAVHAQSFRAPSEITVVSDDNYPPYVFRDHVGALKGILPDQWNLWEKKTGVRVNLMAMDWAKAQQVMGAGQADVIDTIFFTEERGRLYHFSKPYAQIEVPVFFHKTLSGITDVQSLKGFTIGVKEGDACHEVLKSQGIDTLKEYPSYTAIIQAAVGNEIRVFSVDQPPAQYYLYKLGVAEDYRQSCILYTGALHRAYHKDRKDLMAFVEEGFRSISKGEYERINRKWMGAPPMPLFPHFQAVLYTLLASVFLVLVLVIFNVLLRRKVKGKTSELKELVDILRESEESYRGLFDSVKEAIYIQDPHGVFLAVNQGAVGMYGYPPEFFIGKTPEVLSAPGKNNMEDLRRRIEKALAGEPQQFEFWGRRANGEFFPKEIRLCRGRYFGQEVIIALAFDITDRKMAEESLRVSRDYLSAIFHSVHDGLIINDAGTGRILDVNQRMCEMCGYTHSEVLKMDLGQLSANTPPYTQENITAWWQKVRQEGPQVVEWLARHKTGRLFWVEVSVRLALIDQEERFIALVRDISQRKEAEEALRQKTAEVDRFFEMALDLLCIADKHGYFRRVNAQWVTALGYELKSLEGCRFLDLVHPDDVERTLEAMKLLDQGGEILNFTNRYRHKDGSYRWIEWRSKPYGDLIYAAARDITDRRMAEEERLNYERQIQQAQKLESLGVLAGGIAHDFNNLLTAILGNIDLALVDLSPASPAREDILAAEKATHRAAELAKQMLAYSGKGCFVIQTLDLRELVKEMTHMLQVSISKKAVFRLHFAENLPPVQADATQLRQVVMNLVINASEAIEERSGVIALSVGAHEYTKEELASFWTSEDLPGGLYVYLEVADTGCGISQEQRERIFDPFYTTKFTGRGLGLAAVMGIVRSHRGAIHVTSQPGKGTTFRVLFPASAEGLEQLAKAPSSAGWKGKGLVLLVDDEESVCATGKKMLEYLGLTVIPALDGMEAVQLFRAKAADIACVLLDMTMPHMDGVETFNALREIRPDVPVIISSGYNEQDVIMRFGGKGPAGFVQKPYKITALSEVLERVLG